MAATAILPRPTSYDRLANCSVNRRLASSYVTSMLTGTRIPAAASLAPRNAGSGFGAVDGFAPKTTRVMARIAMALDTDVPEPRMGPTATSVGSSTSQVLGAISIGVCSDVHTCCALGRRFVSFGVL